MALIIPAMWIGSALAGWFWFPLWLIAPPVVMALYALNLNNRVVRRLKQMDVGASDYHAQMAWPTIRVGIIAIIQHGAIFGLAAALGLVAG